MSVDLVPCTSPLGHAVLKLVHLWHPAEGLVACSSCDRCGNAWPHARPGEVWRLDVDPLA